MSQFEVFKDISLFLQKVYLRLIHQDQDPAKGTIPGDNAMDRQAEEDLIKENPSGDEMESPAEDPWRRRANLTIRSYRMPQFRKKSLVGGFPGFSGGGS